MVFPEIMLLEERELENPNLPFTIVFPETVISDALYRSIPYWLFANVFPEMVQLEELGRMMPHHELSAMSFSVTVTDSEL